MQLSVPLSTFNALEQTLRRPFFSPLGLHPLHLSKNDRKFPRCKRRRRRRGEVYFNNLFFMYVCPAVSGRRNRSGERRDGRKYLMLFLPSFPSFCNYSGWLEICSDFNSFLVKCTTVTQAPRYSMARIQPFLWMHVYS